VKLKKIIVGYDGGAESRDALSLGRLLAEQSGGRLILAAVLPVRKEAIGLEGYQAAVREDSQRLFAEALEGLAGLEVETRAVGDEAPPEALRALAEHEDVHMIVVGSTHRGPLGRIYPGSVAERLLHGAPCAVAVAQRDFRLREQTELRVLAAAFDGSPESFAALEVASRMAEASEATLRVISVQEPFKPGAAAIVPMGAPALDPATQREAMEERLHEAVASLPSPLRVKGLLLKGPAAEELLKEMELGVDLLVMGSRGRGGLARVLLGAVSAKVVRSAPCPVVVVPEAARPRGRASARALAEAR
jgi:nucleotide-binding universal stress UspA family protein